MGVCDRAEMQQESIEEKHDWDKKARETNNLFRTRVYHR